ncbi:MAG: DoxX family protein [Mesorhizobium sp.]
MAAIKEALFMRSDDKAKFLLRLTISFLMLFHGMAKLTHGVEWIKQPLAGVGMPLFFAYGVFFGEVLAPMCMILGFRTRLAALVMAFNMLMAIILVWGSKVFAVNAAGGWAIELEVLFMLGAMVLFYSGGGKYAISKNSKWD